MGGTGLEILTDLFLQRAVFGLEVGKLSLEIGKLCFGVTHHLVQAGEAGLDAAEEVFVLGQLLELEVYVETGGVLAATLLDSPDNVGTIAQCREEIGRAHV